MPSTGICVLSIDIVRDDARTVELCRQLSDARLRVTWGLSSPPSSEFADAIHSHNGNEVALRAGGWASEPSDRRTFIQSLTANLGQLRAAGFATTTIALPAGSLVAHDDLLVKNAVSAVRVTTPRASSTSRRAARLGSINTLHCLSSLRWGLWEAVVSVDLSPTGLGTALRTMDRICDAGGAAIVAAPSDLLSSDPKTADRLINHLTNRQEQGVRLTTLAGIVAELMSARPTSAHSILRPAA